MSNSDGQMLGTDISPCVAYLNQILHPANSSEMNMGIFLAFTDCVQEKMVYAVWHGYLQYVL